MTGGWTEADVERVRVRLIAPPRPGSLPVPVAAPKPKAIGRQVKPKGMNKTESRYAGHLDLQKNYGDVIWWGFEAMAIRIGANCFFHPDFLVQYADGHLELHDTKAHGRKSKAIYHAEDDAIVKARSVGANFPIPVYFVWSDKDGEWAKREM